MFMMVLARVIDKAAVEGSRPEFGRAIAYWVFNRNRDTSRGNVATGRIATSGHVGIK